jgi:hypothetical protein
MTPCPECFLSPCVCDYVATLAPGGRNERLAAVAFAMAAEPLPHRGGEGSCPCPVCYSALSRSWDEWLAERNSR